MTELPRPPLWRPVKVAWKDVNKLENRAMYLAANQAIELDYKAYGKTDTYLVGSDFATANRIRLPRGAPNKRFGDFLLDRLNGLVNQRKPDIVDFEHRTFYEIKPIGSLQTKIDKEKAKEQLASLYRLAKLIHKEDGVADVKEWDVTNVKWKPKPMWMPGNPDQRVVTVTNRYGYKEMPGIII